MTVSLEDGVIHLIGVCSSGDAEELLQCLLSDSVVDIDWRRCDAAHSAVVQVLLAAKRQMIGPPRGAALAAVVAPALLQGKDSGFP
jgi:hypothetical protein